MIAMIISSVGSREDERIYGKHTAESEELSYIILLASGIVNGLTAHTRL